MSETKRFDVPEVLAALEAAVAKRGEDYVYVTESGQALNDTDGLGDPVSSPCRYVHHRDTDNAVPGCIVGQVFYDLTGQLMPEEFEDLTPVNVKFNDLRLFTKSALSALATAQLRQDEGRTWGEALAAASAVARNG